MAGDGPFFVIASPMRLGLELDVERVEFASNAESDFNGEVLTDELLDGFLKRNQQGLDELSRTRK